MKVTFGTNQRRFFFPVVVLLLASVSTPPATAQIGGNCVFTGPVYCSRTLTDPSTRDGLGRKVAIDGNICVSGAILDAYVELFDFNTGDSLLVIPEPNSGSISDSFFGYSMALKGDRLVVGSSRAFVINSPNFERGQVHLFDLDLTNMTTTNTTVISDPTQFGPTGGTLSPHGGEFGHDVDLDGDHIVVGEPFQQESGGTLIAGMAHVYSAVDGSFIQTYENPSPADSDAYGSYVAIEEDGNGDVFIAISATGDDTNGTDSGCVYLYDTSSLTSTQNPVPELAKFPRTADIALIQPLVSGMSMTGIGFGQDSDIDNGRLLITFKGGAILYDLTDPTFPVLQTFDHTVDTVAPEIIFPSQTGAISGDTVVIGTPEFYLDIMDTGGSVHVFDVATGTETQTIFDPTLRIGIINNPLNFAESWPNSVAIDGNNIAAGSLYADGVYEGEVSMFRKDPLFGDCNFDGTVSLLDVSPFNSYVASGEYLLEADINLDGKVDLLDAAPFAALVSGN